MSCKDRYCDVLDVALVHRYTPLRLLHKRWTMGGVDCLNLAKCYNTPLFVLDEECIQTNCISIRDAFSSYRGKTQIRYAVKANSNLAVLRLIHQVGFGAEVASTEELAIALAAGIPPSEIILNGNAKSDEQLHLAVSKQIQAIVADTKDELQRINQISAGQGIITPCAIRVNLGFSVGGTWDMGDPSSKFGVPYNEVLRLYHYVHRSLYSIKLVGLHSNLGSQIMDEHAYISALTLLVRLFKDIFSCGVSLDFIDMGGGFPVRTLLWSEYSTSSKTAPSKDELLAQFDIHEFGQKVLSCLHDLLGNGSIPLPDLLLEPGRSIVTNSGVLIATVQTTKPSPNSKMPAWIAIDAGCHTLPDAWICNWFFECMPLDTRLYSKSVITQNIAGPLCDSGDVLGRNRLLPKMKHGDLIVFLQVGGYQIEMQSNFHMLPRAAVVIVKNGQHELIQPRRVLHC